MAEDRVAMSLDDLIKTDKKFGRRDKSGSRGNNRGNRGGNRSGNRGRVQKRTDSPGRGRGRGRYRGQRYDSFNRRSRSRSRSPDMWEHDKYRGPMPAGYEGRATSRLMVSNLDFGVDDRDMKELFSQFGQLIECRVLYERNGRSTGTAEITFDSVANARKAKQEYHRVPLDGREMKIVFIAERQH